ncbi:MAG: GNAT family N-acetyltransferase [Erysipelotrichaceae bacterium]|nr:GNAT family N-acetyltransferase [Erysipelotrichaceae bacterium]
MFVKELDYNVYKRHRYSAEIHSDRYLSIRPQGEGFDIKWIDSEKEIVKYLEDEMLSEWLEDPVAYGAFEDNKLIGYIEGFHEKWNNRFRITNICIFDSALRGIGIGTRLLDAMMVNALQSGSRMIVLETQSYNSKAIAFYKKNGFEIIGFDRFAYSNSDPEENNMRIEMGKRL